MKVKKVLLNIILIRKDLIYIYFHLLCYDIKVLYSLFNGIRQVTNSHLLVDLFLQLYFIRTIIHFNTVLCFPGKFKICYTMRYYYSKTIAVKFTLYKCT